MTPDALAQILVAVAALAMLGMLAAIIPWRWLALQSLCALNRLTGYLIERVNDPTWYTVEKECREIAVQQPEQDDCRFRAWVRRWGDGRNQWEPIARRPTEESCRCCLGRYLEEHPDVSAVVLPVCEEPEFPPPLCEPAEGEDNAP